MAKSLVSCFLAHGAENENVNEKISSCEKSSICQTPFTASVTEASWQQ